MSRATVSLIDAAGVTRAAGVTTESGAFTLYQSRTPFTPENGQAFVLQAMKRVVTPSGTRWLSLKTELVRENGTWRSIAGDGDDVVISIKTTAIAKIDAARRRALTRRRDGHARGRHRLGPRRCSPAEVAAYATALEALIPEGIDPGGPVVYHGDASIATQADADALLAYDVIEGGLDLSPDSPDVVIELPHLQRVRDWVGLDIEDITSLNGLRGLTRVGASTSAAFGFSDLSDSATSPRSTRAHHRDQLRARAPHGARGADRPAVRSASATPTACGTSRPWRGSAGSASSS